MLTPTALALLIELADVKPEDVVWIFRRNRLFSRRLAGLSSPSSRLKIMKRLTKNSEIWQELGIDNVVAVCGPPPDGQLSRGLSM